MTKKGIKVYLQCKELELACENVTKVIKRRNNFVKATAKSLSPVNVKIYPTQSQSQVVPLTA